MWIWGKAPRFMNTRRLPSGDQCGQARPMRADRGGLPFESLENRVDPPAVPIGDVEKVPDKVRDIAVFDRLAFSDSFLQDPPRLLGLDKVFVDLSGVRKRFLDRLFRDLVKHQPMYGHLRLEQLVQMPTDGLAFAIFVGR